ncbi:unnamed protein product [Rangifer tarandus platyrhynchus]|uniref:Uncharacterized protein n=1 Tax=Rangifer tarandus platyrhynchus TaxID=3082113 RepID=A0AC59Z6A0_RANTA
MIGVSEDKQGHRAVPLDDPGAMAAPRRPFLCCALITFRASRSFCTESPRGATVEQAARPDGCGAPGTQTPL